jgi:hypothetical protein
MNDGVRRSLLVARVAKLQVEDEAELAADVSLAKSWAARPGWGASNAAVGEWVGEQPSPVPGSVMDGALQAGWAVVDGGLQSDTSEARAFVDTFSEIH